MVIQKWKRSLDITSCITHKGEDEGGGVMIVECMETTREERASNIINLSPPCLISYHSRHFLFARLSWLLCEVNSSIKINSENVTEMIKIVMIWQKSSGRADCSQASPILPLLQFLSSLVPWRFYSILFSSSIIFFRHFLLILPFLSSKTLKTLSSNKKIQKEKKRKEEIVKISEWQCTLLSPAKFSCSRSTILCFNGNSVLII